jgi:integrase
VLGPRHAGSWQLDADEARAMPHGVFIFCRRESGWMLPLLLERTRSAKRVRARTLAADTFETIRSVARAGASDPLVADQLALALVPAYRCGLRIGEIVKLRIEDIESSYERTLFIRQNSYGSNKSHAARRKIVCGRILTPDEGVLFDRVVAVRRRQGNLSGTLFQTPGRAMPFDRSAVSSAISNALRDATTNRGWTFHHLRHSAANNIILTVLDATKLAKRLAG